MIRKPRRKVESNSDSELSEGEEEREKDERSYLKQAFGLDDAQENPSQSEMSYTEERVMEDDDINEMMDDMLSRHKLNKMKLYTGKGEGRKYNLDDIKRIYALEMSNAPELFGNTPGRNSLLDEKVKTFQAHL